MVLLPSALSCDSGSVLAHPRPHKPTRPSLPLFERYETHHRSRSPALGLIASCRALHNMIGECLLPSPNIPPQIPRRDPQYSNPFDQGCSSGIRPSPKPQRSNKRSRDELESQDIMAHDRLLSPRKRHNTSYSTPRPRRAAPMSLPRGLQVSDFEALDEPTYMPASATRPRKEERSIEMPAQHPQHEIPASPQKDMIWTPNDDRMLVETVLSKLNLSSQEWNECAKSLGKDKDSLDRRWQLLIGSGNVGLRRGMGKHERTELDIESW